MLYGNLIFIKKTGGDGSKFPVTERDIKIGRSEDCLIRIYNSQVAPEHCHLIIEDNGQMTLRNLSKETVLNGKPLGQGDVTLCHGDIFKVGERLARWEYLPNSKYYRQLLSPTGRLVAVVMPQQRSMGEQETPGTSTSQISILKNTPLGKRLYSERGSSEASAAKIRKSSGTDLIRKAKWELPKFLTGRHSLKTKSLLQGAKAKERKSISGTISSKTPKGKFGGKSRKSTLPSWKVNIVTPPQRKSTSKNSPTNSNKKSAKSTKNAVKTPLSDVIGSESSQKLLTSISKSGLKTPQKVIMASESFEAGSISGTPVKAKTESPSFKNEESVTSTGSFSKTPSAKKKSPKSASKTVLSTPKPKPPKLARLAHSESKLSSRAVRQEIFPKGRKRMSLIVENVNSTPGGSFKKFNESITHRKSKVSEVVSDSVPEKRARRTLLNDESPIDEKQTRKSVKGTPAKKTAEKTGKTPRKSVIVQTPSSAQSTSKVSKSKLGEVTPEVIVKTPLPVELISPSTSKKVKYTPRGSAKSTPVTKTGKLRRSVGKMKLPTSVSKKISIQNETISLASPSDISTPKSTQRSTSPTGRKSVVKETSSKPVASFPKVGRTSPRGVRRKLSPSSSAERAAKMLKTSSPKKPDKNKKAALLVLGKANRKQLLSQNVKVLLKQKIVKKAIKQSTALTSQKSESRKKVATKVKKGLQKTALKTKKTPAGREKSLGKISTPKSSRTSAASVIKSPVKDKTQGATPKEKRLLQTSQSNDLKAESSPNLSSKDKPLETPGKTPSKPNKKLESPRTITSSKSSSFASSPSDVFDKTAVNYLFNSNRRSKRLSSKNDTGRPDFIELSPTALGLMPKNVNIFKTPNDNKRRSSSLVTPKNVRSSGIIKSASTSKIANRKSVRFSSKDMSHSSEFQSPVIAEKVDFDFSSYHTPDVTVDMFVSPLTEKSSVTKNDISMPKSTSATDDGSKTSSTKARGSSSEPKTCVRKLLQSPQIKSSDEVSPAQKSFSQSSRTSAVKSPSPDKHERVLKASRENKNPRNDVDDLDVRQLLVTPKAQKSPKNDLTDVDGIKKLLQTPKVQKSPKNDLTDIRGVKKLLRTPKVQKSPKNDLTDVRGVKKLLRTPKVQKSPKNDLTDVRGVKKLLRTPKVQKSPKNDLSDVRGVKKLLRTPKVQKSPKNDLSDVRGVKKLLRTPKVQKSPKNDLSDVRGIKKLLGTPKEQKSPKNDLNNVVGVKELLGSPRVQKSPKNELSDLKGVKKLFESPKVQRSPKNDLTDVTGVKKLLTTPRGQKSPKNNLLDVSGLGNLFDSPTVQKLSRNSTADVMKVLVNSESEGNLIEGATGVNGVNQLLISKSPGSLSKSKKTVSRKSHVNDYRAIRGRCTIHSSPPKVPKNDLSDLTGVAELFSRHKPTSDYNVSLTGVAELFDLPNGEVDTDSKKGKLRGKSMQSATERKAPAKRTLKSKKEGEDEKGDNTVTRRGRSRKAPEEETEKKATRSHVEEKKPAKRKAVEKIKTSQAKKASGVAKKSGKVTQKETKTVGKKSEARTKAESSGTASEEVKGSRKRRVGFEESETPPAKTRRKLPAAKSVDSGVAAETTSKAVSRSRKETVSEEKVSVRRVKEVSAKAKVTKTSKTSTKVQSRTAAIKTGTKRNQKVQNRSQSSSKTNSSDSSAKGSPRKTRSGKSEAGSKTGQKNVSKTQSKTAEKKTVKATAARGKTTSVKRSTRQK